MEALLAFDGVLIDIREPHEWQQTGIVEGSKPLTLSDPETFLEALEPHLEDSTPIALICRTGNRTQQAGRAIAKRVNVPVINIEGGIVRLMRLGYEPVPAGDR
ncbi:MULTISPECIES: rhodanese-like domain-containing protein [unclassified Halorhodospira]|uniref:rhodanese-like domain-containing protein n=1 Tax=unclassified Halorhodospira TaxID=2626748 RepID=UPI001EE8ED36|nr:rhodanese-like domain-containing protein [Halorhodospira sp. M39old]MCG5545780.1 rhodanese-like domain-containing protein [Halorhodospira sp. M38]